MGANLITFIVTGPETLKLTEKKRKALVKKAEAFQKRAQHLLDTTDKAPPELDNLNEEELANIADQNPGITLCNLLKLWNDETASDTNWRVMRINGKKVKILVAGCDSWGDTPDGHGYQTLRDAEVLKFFGPLGIK